MQVFVKISRVVNAVQDPAAVGWALRPDYVAAYDQFAPISFNNSNAWNKVRTDFPLLPPTTVSAEIPLGGAPNTALGISASNSLTDINITFKSAMLRTTLTQNYITPGSMDNNMTAAWWTKNADIAGNFGRYAYDPRNQLSFRQQSTRWFDFPRSRSFYAPGGVINQPTLVESEVYTRTFDNGGTRIVGLSSDTSVLGAESTSSPVIVDMILPQASSNYPMITNSPGVIAVAVANACILDTILALEVNDPSLDAGAASTAPVYLGVALPNYVVDFHALTTSDVLLGSGSYTANGFMQVVDLKKLSTDESVLSIVLNNVTDTVNGAITSSSVAQSVTFSLQPFAGF